MSFRRVICSAAAVSAVLLIAWSFGACRREPARPTNVLLLVVDTLRADRLGCYGYPRATSPNIDALAERGTLYENNYCQASWTAPSMISMLTGVSVTQEERACPEAIPVLAEVLREQGMETVGFPANAVLGDKRGFERGFETWFGTFNLDAIELAERFTLWHDTRTSGGDLRPWFAWVQFIDPHHPYAPRPEHDVFSGPRPDQDLLVPRWEAAEAEAKERSANLEKTRDLNNAIFWMTNQSNRYDGEVLACDDGIGRMLETLRAAGELEDTLVIVVSDHGEMLYEHRGLPYTEKDRIEKTGGLPDGVADLFGAGHGKWFYEPLWNTPMILAGPGIPKNKRVSSLSANLDVFPTILEALDLPRANRLEGESLFGGASPRRESVMAYGYSMSAVREKQGLKLVENWGKLFLCEDENKGPNHLFDLEHDPHEAVNLAEQRPADVERLHEELEAWKKRSERSAVTVDTEAQRQVLNQLGYADAPVAKDDKKEVTPVAKDNPKEDQ